MTILTYTDEATKAVMTYELDDLPQGHQFFPGIRVKSLVINGVSHIFYDHEWPGEMSPESVFAELSTVVLHHYFDSNHYQPTPEELAEWEMRMEAEQSGIEALADDNSHESSSLA
jgi:hypothetical protein